MGEKWNCWCAGAAAACREMWDLSPLCDIVPFCHIESRAAVPGVKTPFIATR